MTRASGRDTATSAVGCPASPNQRCDGSTAAKRNRKDKARSTGADSALQQAIHADVVEFPEPAAVRDRCQRFVVEQHRPVERLREKVDY
ncbi:MAG: hypothetical protein ACXWD8_00080 [Mycobacterium sp.]